MRSINIAVRVILCIVCGGSVAILHSQRSTPNRWHAEIGPSASLRSPVFTLQADQAIRVWTDAASDVILDAFVYEADTKELAGKSDDEKVEEYFQWNAFAAGRYYVVIRNLSAQRGAFTIALVQQDGGRAATGRPTSVEVQVFYATDRRPNPEPNEKGVTYGAEPISDEALRHGIATVSIPHEHNMGELEGPSILRFEFHENSEKHVVLRSVVAQDINTFYKKISERAAGSPEHEAFVFVHGFDVTFEDAARRTGQIAYDLGFKGAPILYSWPSQGTLGKLEAMALFNYEKDLRNAKLSAARFRVFLSDLCARAGVSTVNVIAHSMGNLVVAQALAEIPDGQRIRPVRVRHVAMMAPDLDAEEFRRLAVAMKRSAVEITLYASSNDDALKVSSLLHGYPRAGMGGKNLVVIPDVVETIDCSQVNTSLFGLGHSYYADSSTILSDLFYLFQGISIAKRVALRPAHNDNGDYWILPKAAH